MVGSVKGWSLQEEALAVFCGLTETHSGNFLGALVCVPPSSNPGWGNFLSDQDLPWLKGWCPGRSNSLVAVVPEDKCALHRVGAFTPAGDDKLLTVAPSALGCRDTMLSLIC